MSAPNPPYATASLYVGDLEPNCTESMLFDVFKKVGSVSSIRVCRDAATRRSLGYAYVNFHNVADAERAIDTLNYTAVGGGEKPCRIMWSHRDPSLRRSGKGNIFIKNLDKSIDHKALCDTFSAFGNILSCKVAQDMKTGESKGFGFVHYENPEAAQAAIEQVNGMLLCGKKVFVGPFQPRKNRGDGSGDQRFTNCYVKDLALEVTEEQMTEAFSKFGEVTSCVIMKDNEGKSRGFGFINFKTPETARAAVEEMNGKEVWGKNIFVSRAQKKGEREAQLKRQFEERKLRYAESNVYVKNLDESIDEAKLKEVFEAFGEIISVKVMKDDKGSSKGFGFVCFSTPEEAHKALSEMNNQMLEGKPLYVALAQRKEVRAAQLQAQYAHRTAGRGIAMQPNPMYPGAGFPMVPQGPGGARVPFAGPYAAGGGQMVGRPPVGGAPRWPAQGRYPQAGMPPQAYPQPRTMPPQNRPRPRKGAPAQQPYMMNQNAANTQQAQEQPVAAAQVAAPHPSLADLSEKDRKQVLGEFLYPKIEQLLQSDVGGDPAETGKITGMLLESLDHGELVHLLESPAELKSRVEEAINVLREHLAATENEAAPAAAAATAE